MTTLSLKNGTQEAEAVVITAMVSLRGMMERDPITFYEAVQVARDPAHKPWDAQPLLELAMIGPDGTMHDSIRNVILSAVQGDGMKMTLGSPVAEAA